MKRYFLLFSLGLLLFTACEQDSGMNEEQVKDAPLTLSVSVDPFAGDEEQTRANLLGTGLEADDWIRIKLICPYSANTEQGETLDNTQNGFWLLKPTAASSSTLTNLRASDGCDLNGDFIPSDSPNLQGQYLTQQTPYVFTASTWNEEVSFYYSRQLYLHYACVFQADQSRADGKAYKKNDLLWAQQFVQTGSPYVHLTFQHKMAALKITVDDSELGSESISSDAVLTLEGMPDIDQMEIVVGDYYADKDAYDTRFGYRQQASCSQANNGKVIGALVIDHSASRAKTYSMTGNPMPAGGSYNTTAWGTIPNTGTYKAFHDAGKVYRLIVPPCELTQKPVFYLRDGSRRFRMELNHLKFEQGVMYNLTLKVLPSTTV